MKKILLLSLIALQVFFADSTFAQFTIDAEFRTVGELRHGYKKIAPVESDAAFLISQRSRLNFSYDTEDLKAKFSLQDVRLWGDEDVYNATVVQGKTDGLTDIYESWVDFKVFNNSRLKIGRQVLNYDDMRFLSWRNWLQTGATYDAFLYKYSSKASGLDIHLGLTWNNNGDKYFDNNYYTDRFKTLNFLYVKKKFGDKLYASFSTIATGTQSENLLDPKNELYMRWTQGVHINYNDTKGAGDGIFLKANAFVQYGKNSTGQSVSANMATAYVGYRTLDKKMSISVGADYLSGNDASNTSADYADNDHAFSMLYGARFPYYGGNINQITVNDKQLKGGGLVNSFVKLNYKMNKKTSVALAVHNNRLATNVVAANDADNDFYDKGLGTNLDLVFTSKMSKEIQFKVGTSYALPSETFLMMSGIQDDAGNYESGNNYFAWVMLIVKPTFFKK